MCRAFGGILIIFLTLPQLVTANDRIADAINLGSAFGKFELVSPAVDGQREENEPMELEGDAEWWRWTSERDAAIEMNLSFHTGGIFVEGPAGELVRADIEPTSSNGIEHVLTTAGQVYWIARVYEDEPFFREATVEFGPIQANDAFLKAPTITGSGTSAADFFGGSLEPAEIPFIAGNHLFGGASLWWKWEASDTGLVMLTLSPENRSSLGNATMLSVLTGDSLDTLHETVRGSRHSGEVDQALMSFWAEAGTNYWIRAESSGWKTLQLGWDDSRAGHPHSQLVNAQGLGTTVMADVRVTTEGAYLEPGAPLGDRRASFNPFQLVWLKWQAPFDADVRLSAPSMRHGPSKLVAYEGESLNSLVSLGESKDGWVLFRAESGKVYHFAILASGVPQSFDLQLTAEPYPVKNGVFSTAIDLGQVGSYWEAVDFAGVGVEPGEPNVESNGQTLWWRWTAPEDGDLAAGMEVYEGNDLSTLTRLRTEKRGERGGFYPVQQGHVYQLRYHLRHGATAPEGRSIIFSPVSERSAETTLGTGMKPTLTRLPRPNANGQRVTQWVGYDHANSILINAFAKGQSPTLSLHDNTEFILSNPGILVSRSDRPIEAGPYLIAMDYLPSQSAPMALGRMSRNNPEALQGASVSTSVSVGPAGSIVRWMPSEPGVAQATTSSSRPVTILPYKDGSLFAPGFQLLPAEHNALDATTRFRVEADGRYTMYLSSAGLGTDEVELELSVLSTPQTPQDYVDSAQDLGTVTEFEDILDFQTPVSTGLEDLGNQWGDIWWKWQAPQEGVLSVKSMRSQIGIYRGSPSVSNLEPLLQSRDAQRVSAEETLWIRHSTSIAWPHAPLYSTVTLTWSPALSPDNDAFANAFSLLPQTSIIDTSSATFSELESDEVVDGFVGSLWWRWSSPDDVKVWLSKSDTTARMQVYHHSSDGQFELITSGISYARFSAISKETYYLKLLVPEGAPPTMSIRVSVPISPHLPTAEDTRQIDERGDFVALLESNGDDVRTFRWAWTAPQTGIAWLQGRDLPPRIQSYPRAFAVYEGGDPLSLRSVRQEALRDSKWFAVQEGQTYTLSIGLRDPTVMPLTLSTHVAASNDAIDLAVDLGRHSTAVYEGLQLAASRDGREPPVTGCHEQTLWWEWQAPSDGVFTATVEGLAESEITLYNHTDHYEGLQYLDSGRTPFTPVQADRSYLVRLSTPHDLAGSFILRTAHRASSAPTMVTLSEWLSERIGHRADAASTADPDGDGWASGLEYIFDTDPLLGDSIPNIHLQFVERGFLSVEFRRRAGLDLPLVHELTNDLLSWKAAAGGAEEIFFQDAQTVGIRLRIPIAAGEKQTFYRFRSNF